MEARPRPHRMEKREQLENHMPSMPLRLSRTPLKGLHLLRAGHFSCCGIPWLGIRTTWRRCSDSIDGPAAFPAGPLRLTHRVAPHGMAPG